MTTAVSQLSGAQLRDALILGSTADSVELKLTIPDAGQRSAISALRLDPLDARIRQVYFFDTTDLALDAAGVVVRARRGQGRADDTVIKLRPVVPDELPPDIRTSRNVTVEVDAMPGGFVCSASFKRRLRKPVVRSTVLGAHPNSDLFSKRQQAFFADHAPAGIEMDALQVLGPIFVLKLKFSPPSREAELAAEMWLYPDGSRILELSTRCTAADAVVTAVRARAFLEGRGVDLTGEQQTKTKTALEFFASEVGTQQNESESAPEPRSRRVARAAN